MSPRVRNVASDQRPVTIDEVKNGIAAYQMQHSNDHWSSSVWHGFACDAFTYNSSPPPTCPQSCPHCQDQFVPEKARHVFWDAKFSMHDDPTAASVIKGLIDSIQEDYASLRSSIDEYGNQIIKRWQKKSSAERKQLICNAMPTILDDRFSEIECFFEDLNYVAEMRRSKGHMRSPKPADQRSEDTFLVPFLNAQALSESKTRLLALIHHRAHAHPAEWIPFDREAIRDEFNSASIKSAYNPHCVSIYPTSSKFGSLVPWEENDAHSFRMIGYPLARQIFRTQATISRLLRSVVNVLLANVSVDTSKGRERWDALVQASFNSTSRVVAKSPYSYQAFAPPPRFQFTRFAASIKLQHDSALDDAVLVNSDAVYLRHLFDETKKSYIHNLHDLEGKRKILFMLPFQNMIQYETWDHLYTMLLAFSFIGSRCPDLGDGQRPLPHPYDKALLMLESSLRLAFWRQAEELNRLLRGHPSFRLHYRGSRMITNPQTAFRNDRLFWVLNELAGNNYTGTNRPPSWCFSFFEEHLAMADKKERQRVDQTLYDHLAEMAAIDELVMSLVLHPSHSPARNKSSAQAIYKTLGAVPTHAVLIKSLESCFKLPEIHDALQAFLSVPLKAKPATPEKLDENKMLNEKFSEYWQLVHTSVLKQVASATIDDGFKSGIKEKLRYFRRPHASIFKAQQTAIENAIAAKGLSYDTTPSILRTNIHTADIGSSINEAHFATCGLQPDPQPINSKALAKETEAKVKIKTRPEPSTIEIEFKGTANPLIVESSEAVPHSPSTIIGVKAKTAAFFRQMFSCEEIQQQRDWDDLVAAMVDAGCSAMHNGGSAVTFEDERNKKGSIVLHKPHPKTTIYPIMLRSIGHRLTRRLGWGADTFVEGEKEGSE